MKMLSVPSVTMNGGSRSRVTSAPLSRPHAVPTPKPMSSASRPGTPWSADSLAITIDESTMIAPTDRSMPAVRMISVWAMPSVPTTITCWTISDRLPGCRNRSAVRLKMITARTRTNSGPSVALECRMSWMRVPSVSGRADPTAPAVPAPCGAGTSFLNGFDMAV